MSGLGDNDDEEAQKNTEFRFVTEPDKQGVRSHAMREHWKGRHRRMSLEKKHRQGNAKKYLPLQPSLGGFSSHSFDNSQAPPPGSAPSSSNRIHELTQVSSSSAPSSGQSTSDEDGRGAIISGIPSQVLSGVNLALSSGRLDPFDQFPIKLTAEHHKLLHHWLSTFGAMMFGDQHLLGFNPMRDVWLPLDLSNAASFNAVMAHSAAHLARMRGRRISMEALKFKAEAIRIISLWMSEERLALSDEILAAVLRLLTYERYWGSESEWQVHHDGLLRMIEARGGIVALQTNWRLELVATFSNQIQELSKPATSNRLQPILGDEQNLHRVRSLWLLSFVQDMANFMTTSSELYLHGLARYRNLQDALKLIKIDMQRSELIGKSTSGSTYTTVEHQRLSCLFFVCVLLQGTTTTDANAPGITGTTAAAQALGLSRIVTLDEYLLEARGIWVGSVSGLFDALFGGFISPDWAAPNHGYILSFTDVLGSMSHEARRGVEKSLLHLLGQTAVDVGADVDYDWTPDALLSNLHGE